MALPANVPLLRQGYRIAEARCSSRKEADESACNEATTIKGPGWFRENEAFPQTKIARGLNRSNITENFAAYREQIQALRTKRSTADIEGDVSDDAMAKITEESAIYAENLATIYTQQDLVEGMQAESNISFEQLLGFGNQFPFIEITSSGGRATPADIYRRGDNRTKNNKGLRKIEAVADSTIQIGADSVLIRATARSFGSQAFTQAFLNERLASLTASANHASALRVLINRK